MHALFVWILVAHVANGPVIVDEHHAYAKEARCHEVLDSFTRVIGSAGTANLACARFPVTSE